MTQLLPPKKEVALALLERSNVDVYLDPRAKGVVVPPQFKKEPRLILKIGLNMPVPIPDLRVDDESMSCTLSFSRTPFYCVVPWPSVFAMVGEDGRGMVWPDDVPQELAVRVVEEAPAGPAPSPVEAVPAPSSKRKGGGAGKKKKKKDEAAPRPALVAVPEPAKSAPSLERRVGVAKEGPRAPSPVPVPAPAPSRAPRSTGPDSRPKRELPPYLRVVK